MTTHRTTLVVGLAAVMVAATACASTGAATPAARPPSFTTASAPAAASSTAPQSASRTVQPERSTPTAATAVPPALARVDRGSIDAVATAVVTAFNTADTTTDSGPNDTAARTVSLLTADYAAGIVNTPPLRSPGAQWNSWAAQGVRLGATVKTLPDDRPVDTTTTATRIYLVTQTPTTRTGQVLAPVVTVAYVGLRRGTSGWAVAQVEQR